jgi:type I restriction enzyme, S subunit
MSEWAVLKISDVASVIDSLHQTPLYETEGFPMVRVTDIVTVPYR